MASTNLASWSVCFDDLFVSLTRLQMFPPQNVNTTADAFAFVDYALQRQRGMTADEDVRQSLQRETRSWAMTFLASHASMM